MTRDERRLDDLTARLAARTDGEGKPRPGFKNNVIALRAKIAVLQARIAQAGGGIAP